MGRNWNPCTWLMEMLSGAAPVENSLVVPQKDKHSHHLTQQFLS